MGSLIRIVRVLKRTCEILLALREPVRRPWQLIEQEIKYPLHHAFVLGVSTPGKPCFLGQCKKLCSCWVEPTEPKATCVAIALWCKQVRSCCHAFNANDNMGRSAVCLLWKTRTLFPLVKPFWRRIVLYMFLVCPGFFIKKIPKPHLQL